MFVLVKGKRIGTVHLIADKPNKTSGDRITRTERKADGTVKYMSAVEKHTGRKAKPFGVRTNVWHYTVREMEEETGMAISSITEARPSVSKRLMKVADDGRIQEIESEIAKIQAKGKHSQKLLDEYNQRISVREALKKLLVLLTPPESTKEMNGSVNLPAYTFEREMNVGTGMREGIENVYHMMKTKAECHVPEYMKKQFGDPFTCCMLCTTCRRSKDADGRCSGAKDGIWHTS